MSDYSLEREYYEHDTECKPEELGPLKVNGTRYCKGCGGSFRMSGEGVAVTSKRFD